jgi:ribosome-associated toxin RatA of RatAB toxin-antitoxin module
MALRGVVLCAFLSSTGLACMNTAQSRARAAALDQVAPPPASLVAPAATARRAGPDPAETPEVEVVPVAGSRLGRSRATVLVRASVERIRTVLVDFAHYHTFLPNYRSAEVVGTRPDGGSRVHMQIDGLGGVIRRWMNVELSPPVTAGSRVSFEAKLIDGNVKAFEARWVLDKLEEGATRLTLESYLDPDLQLPAAFIDAGSAAGLKESILAIKARAEDGP